MAARSGHLARAGGLSPGLRCVMRPGTGARLWDFCTSLSDALRAIPMAIGLVLGLGGLGRRTMSGGNSDDRGQRAGGPRTRRRFRPGRSNSFAERREAARQRLTTTARAALVVDVTLQTLDRRLAAWVSWGPSSASTPADLAGSAAPLLTVAHATPGYDLPLAHGSGVRVRVRNSDHGLAVASSARPALPARPITLRAAPSAPSSPACSARPARARADPLLQRSRKS